MNNVFLTPKSFNGVQMNYVFDSIFYTEMRGRIVEAKVEHISWRKELVDGYGIGTTVVVIYRTPFGVERFADYTLNKLPLFKTPSCEPGTRAFSEWNLKVMSCEVSAKVDFRHYDTGKAVFGLGCSVVSYVPINGKIEKKRSMLVGMDFVRNSPVLFYFANDISSDATCGRWDSVDRSKLERPEPIIMDSHDAIAHLCKSQTDAEKELIESGGVIRFGDDIENLDATPGTNGEMEVLKFMAKSMGLDIDITIKRRD